MLSHRLIKFNKKLSWTLVFSSTIILLSGYTLTILNIQSPIIAVGHRALGPLFTIIILLHFYISIVITRYNWKKSISSIWNGTAGPLTWLRFGQRITGWGIIIPASLILLSGLDWFKIGTGWIIPFTAHIRFDIYLSIMIILHTSIGLKFALMRRRLKRNRLGRADSFSTARREALTIMASMLLSLIAITYLDRIPRIADVKEKISNLLPPEQYEVDKLRILHIGSVPIFDEENWDFEVYGLVRNPITMSYSELKKLPKIVSISDFHCVTGWSKFDNKWEGIRFRDLMKMVEPMEKARYATIECENDYTTSLPLKELEYDDIILAYRLDDEDLPKQYGGPLRIVVPHKYAYKSGKWVRKIKLTEKQELGYWETRGYSNTADPFTNDRYSSTP
jgi:DMSO/TMAO reductase YedYZ molybdopterin-dependent catalytic subunit